MGSDIGIEHQMVTSHSASTEAAILAEKNYSAQNYQSLPVVLACGQGASVWDPEGNHYLDFHSASNSLNHGHCHAKLVQTLVEQASCLTLTSRTFHNNVYPQFAEFMTKLFGYDRILPTTTGTEASEASITIARNWAHRVKGVPQNEAIILGAGTNRPITFNDKAALREAFEAVGPSLAAFIVESIQADGGAIVADDDYLQEARALCDKHHALLICDEIQTGIARTGKLLGHYWSGIRPDMVLLGKSLTGGMYPVSCVLGNNDVMAMAEPGTHDSIYGGNPLGAAIAMRALEVVEEENLSERAERLGQVLRKGLAEIQVQIPGVIQTVRGRGLLNVFVIDQSKTNGHTGIRLCEIMTRKGLLVRSPVPGTLEQFH